MNKEIIDNLEAMILNNKDDRTKKILKGLLNKYKSISSFLQWKK